MNAYLLLILKEIKDVFHSKSGIVFLILSSIIIGNSFFTAVDLYSKASIAAINNPLYATGFEPVPGVFRPTYGAIFVLFSILLPFVIIPVISNEKKYNTITLLLQFPFSFSEILSAKIIASIVFVISTLILIVPSLILWKIYGGHLPIAEIYTLTLGYLLYGITIISISLCYASLFENTSTAAILSIATILTSWIIDFTKDTNSSKVILLFSKYTMTKMLKLFEDGILSLGAILYFIIVSIFFCTLCYITFRFDIKNKWKYILSITFIFLFAIILSKKNYINWDITESHKNSFPAKITEALKKAPPIVIEVYLRKTDSRYKDFENDFLKKLTLIRPDTQIHYIDNGKELDKNYGLFIYNINGKTDKTYSNSEEEIIPIILGLSGINIPKEDRSNFKGYPLSVNNKRLSIIKYIYYFIIPIIILLCNFLTPLKNLILKRSVE